MCGSCVVYVLRLRDDECVVLGSLGVSTGNVQVMDGDEYSLFYRRDFNNRQNTYLAMLAVVVLSWDVSCEHCLKVTVRLYGSCRRVG